MPTKKNRSPPLKKLSTTFQNTCPCRNFIQRPHYPVFAAFFVPAIVVGTFVPTIIVGTASKEMFVPAIIVGTVVPEMIVGTAVPTIIVLMLYYWRNRIFQTEDDVCAPPRVN